MIYAVIDTNVFVAALLTKSNDSATVKVYDAIADGLITPLYHKDILEEYGEVLSRPKFKFSKERINAVLDMIVKYGVEVFPKPTGEILIDMDDLIFYEVAMEKRDDDRDTGQTRVSMRQDPDEREELQARKQKIIFRRNGIMAGMENKMPRTMES